MSGTKVRGGLVLVSALMAMRGPVQGLTLAIFPGHVACATRIDYRDSALITKVRQALTKMPASGIKSPDSCAGAHAHQFAGACSCARREKHPGGRILPFWRHVESTRTEEHMLSRSSSSTAGRGSAQSRVLVTKLGPVSYYLKGVEVTEAHPHEHGGSLW